MERISRTMGGLRGSSGVRNESEAMAAALAGLDARAESWNEVLSGDNARRTALSRPQGVKDSLSEAPRRDARAAPVGGIIVAA